MYKVLIFIFFLFLFAFRDNPGTAGDNIIYDTVPTGVPQLFGGKFYQFKGYVLVDSFLMTAPGDTNNIPYYPSFEFKSSDNRWYGYDRSRWQRLLFPGDTTSLSNRINQKLNISDTSSMLSPYVRKADTAAMLANYINITGYGIIRSGQGIRIDTGATGLATQYDLTQLPASTNSNIGSGFRLAVPNTNNIKTVFGNNTITLDSTSNANAITFKTDTGVISTKWYAQSQITGVSASRNSYATDRLYQGQAYIYNWSDSAMYPELIPKFKLSIQRGSGLIIFGNSIASPSVNPPTDSMHSEIMGRSIGGTVNNYAVGGTNMHAQLARINQEGLLARDRTAAVLWQGGIDCREDTSIYADRAVYYSARVVAARAFYRDTLVLTSGITFTGSWSNYNAGIAAGSISNGRYTTTSGDFFDFQITGRNAFFTFFSENPNDNPTNFTDSVQVNVDGVYYNSYDMSNIGIQAGGKYLCAIFIQNMSNAVHNIRVVNRRTDTMAIDFAGSLKDPADCYPLMCELMLPVGNGYIGGSGSYKKLRFNRLNLAYTSDIFSQLQRWGYPVIAIDPRNGVDMNDPLHTLDWLHPSSMGQRLMFQSIWPQINIYKVPDGVVDWHIAGNSGTTGGTHFVGTTDDQPVYIKANNVTRAYFGTNNNVGLMQYPSFTGGSSNSFIAGAGTAGASALFAASLGRAYVNAQDATSLGGPDTKAEAIGSLAQGDSWTMPTAHRSVAFARGRTIGENTTAIGWETVAKAYKHVVFGTYNDTTGYSLITPNSYVLTDPIFTVGAGDSTASTFERKTVFEVLKNGRTRLWQYGAGTITGTPTFNLSVTSNGTIIETSAATTLYSGDGSIASNRTVTLGSNNLTFDASSSGDLAFTLGSDANYDIFYRNGSGKLTRLAAGTDGNVLTTHSTTSAPTWEAANYTSGTYTPTLTNGANVTASTAYQCQYMRVGNVVTVSGKVDIDPSATGVLTVLGISLPIVSSLPNDFNVGGTAISGASEGLYAAIRANTTSETAELVGTLGGTASTGNNAWHFHFTYLIE